MLSRPRPLFWILLIALILRGALALGARSATGDTVVFTPDTFTYLTCARELVRYGTFTTAGVPEVIRTPGYPLLLIPGVLLGHEQGITIALQIALSLFSAVGVYALGLALTDDRRAGLAGAMMYALEPASIAYTTFLLTETLAATLLVWAVWLLVQYTRSARLLHLACGFVLVVAAAYVRPIALFLPACLVTFFVLFALLSRRPRVAAHAAVAGILALALVIPWSVRNRAAGFPGFSAISGLDMYFYSAGHLLAEQRGISWWEQATQMGWAGGSEWVNEGRYLKLHPEQQTWSSGQRYQFMEREGARILKSNLPQYAGIHARGIVHTLLGTAGGELRTLFGEPLPTGRFMERVRQRSNDWLDLAHIALGLILLAIYALAASRLAFPPWTAGVLLVACVAAYVVVVGGLAGETRFRVPMMPLVCALAGAGWLSVRDRMRRAIRSRS